MGEPAAAHGHPAPAAAGLRLSAVYQQALMPDLAWLVPVCERPHRVKPLLESIRATTPDARVLFIADPDDRPEIQALKWADADYITLEANYAAKIRAGVEETDEAFVFMGADDLLPHAGWFEKALGYMGNGIEAVGINDLCNPRVRQGIHATHFLITRAYAEQPTIDGRPGPLHDGYFHWKCDDEFFATAQKRGVLAVGSDVIVEHLHPMVGKAPDDETYMRGRQHRRDDARMFRRRRRLWLSP